MIDIKDKIRSDRVVTIIIFILLIAGTLTAKCQDAIVYREGQNRVLVVYVKDSIFNTLDDRSNVKRVITYKSKKIRFNQVRFDYKRFYEVKATRRY